MSVKCYQPSRKGISYLDCSCLYQHKRLCKVQELFAQIGQFLTLATGSKALQRGRSPSGALSRFPVLVRVSALFQEGSSFLFTSSAGKMSALWGTSALLHRAFDGDLKWQEGSRSNNALQDPSHRPGLFPRDCFYFRHRSEPHPSRSLSSSACLLDLANLPLL